VRWRRNTACAAREKTTRKKQGGMPVHVALFLQTNPKNHRESTRPSEAFQTKVLHAF
jgi:hypothetical protein